MKKRRFLVPLSLLLLFGAVPAAYANSITFTSTAFGFQTGTEFTLGTFEVVNNASSSAIVSTNLTFFAGAGASDGSFLIWMPVIPAGYHITSAILTASGGASPGAFGMVAGLSCIAGPTCSPAAADFTDTASVHFTNVLGLAVSGSTISVDLINTGLLPQALLLGYVPVVADGTFDSLSLSSITDPGLNADTLLNVRDNTFAFSDGGTLTITAATPEPGTLMLLGTGLTALAGFLRRRRAHRD